MLGMRDVTSYSNDILLYFVINMVINLSVLIGLRKKIIRINRVYTNYLKPRWLITLLLQEQLELLVKTHQLQDLEGSCERYARALLPYLGLNG